ncbi:MAG: hypothetical protein ACXVPN_04305 [Bacteroidia bacterium]
MGTIKQHVTSVGVNIQTSQQTAGITWFSQWAGKFESARFFWMTMIITFQSCLGSIAGGYILQNATGITLLTICSVVTMACNAVLIAQAPAKWCVGISILSVIVNTTLIIALCIMN